MINMRRSLLAALTACLAAGSAWAGEIGEPAPALVVKEWVKGNPVEVKAGTNIYVVEIFTTSSLASRASITNLNAIQDRFRDQGVVVVGIADEPAETLRQFIQREGSRIQYAIAADDKRHTSASYMVPAREKGVPCAFVVGRNGRLLWYGHPQQGLDKVLEAVLAGAYDLPRVEKMEAARIQMTQYLGLARRRDPRTAAAGRVVLAARTNDMALLCDLAFEIATAPRLPKRDFALAAEALDQAEKLSPTNTTRLATTRAVLLFATGKKEEGIRRAREAVAAAKTPPDKANAQVCLRAMEARMKSATTNQMKPATTNRTQSAAGKP